MKHKRYKKGQLVGDFLIYIKEALPKITNSGNRKVRMAYFECALHTDQLYLLSINAAKGKRNECLCDSKFNEREVNKRYFKQDVEDYSLTKEHKRLQKATNQTPPGWIKVTRMAMFIKKKDGSNKG